MNLYVQLVHGKGSRHSPTIALSQAEGPQAAAAAELKQAKHDKRYIYRDHGKENGNYYSILGLYIGIMEKKMETL